MYLTYNEYLTLGYDKVSEEKFNLLEIKVRNFLKYYTMNKSDLAISDLEHCVAELIDLEQERDNATALGLQRLGIKSRTVQSHSISYESSLSGLQAEFDTERVRIARTHLLPLGLLNRGL